MSATSTMKQVREFMDQTEALIARDFLEANGVTCELHGGKEYSTHIVGGARGRYFLSVQEDHLSKAEELLRRSNVKVAEVIEHPTQLPEVSLKKSVMFAVMGVIFVPLVFNWFSVREAIRYARLERSDRKWMWLFLISWLQVPGVLVAYYLIRAALLFSATGMSPEVTQ